MFYTGGEAISEFGLHLPQFDMIAIADEFFTGIPNMHSIRGSKPRLPDNYISALNKVLALKPEWLLGSHVRPIRGKDVIADHVRKYVDATPSLRWRPGTNATTVCDRYTTSLRRLTGVARSGSSSG